MNRFRYWLKVRFSGKESQCNHFCVTCKYFEQCEDELGLPFIGKNEKTTEVKTDLATDEVEIQSDLKKVS